MALFSQMKTCLQQLRLVCRVRSRYAVGLWPAYLRVRQLCRTARFEADEAFRLGLFDPGSDLAALERCVSRKQLTKIQRALNPVSWSPLLTNKEAFRRYCSALGLPVPRTCALWTREAGWLCNGRRFSGEQDEATLFRDQLPDEFVVKPTTGALGRGVRVYRRSGSGFVDFEGNLCSTEQICHTLRGDDQDSSFIVQPLLTNHVAIQRLTGSSQLQTLRVVTLCDRQNRCRILAAHLKMHGGAQETDNFNSGASGNLSAAVELNEGRLTAARTARPDGSGMRSLDRHPATGVAFVEVMVPFWPQICSLAEAAAGHFLPIRTVGWDIALTADGPVLLEGNFWWNPFNQHPHMGQVADLLRQSC